jgi:hypothetical protein
VQVATPPTRKSPGGEGVTKGPYLRRDPVFTEAGHVELYLGAG